MSLDDLVNISITANTATPTQQGFGTPLIAACLLPAAFTQRTRTYSDLTAMVADGFAVTHPAYLAATVVKSQNPSVTQWKIGRRALPPTQIVTLKVLSAVVGTIYAWGVKIPGASSFTPQTFTVVGGTTTTVATAIAALIDPLAGITAVAATDTVTVTSTVAGTLCDFNNWNPELLVKETTTDPGIATDLAAILAADSDWFGLVLDNNSKAEVVSAAAFSEANRKLFGYNTSDTECGDNAVVNDVMSTTQSSSYAFTYGLFSGSQLLSYSGAAWLGHELAYNPDVTSRNWAFKTLAGVPTDSLTQTAENNIRAKNGNTYTRIGGIGLTYEGKSASGQYIDITLGVEWLRVRIKENSFSLLVNNGKVPFTQTGIDMIEAVLRAVLGKATALPDGSQFLASFLVTAPKIGNVLPADKAARRLIGVTFSGVLAGAINKLVMTGVVTP